MRLRLWSIEGILLGFVLAILFFVGRSMLTRRAAPVPPDAIQFSPSEPAASRRTSSPAVEAGDTIVACIDRVVESGWSASHTSVVRVSLPPGFSSSEEAYRDKLAAESGHAAYEWNAPDGSELNIHDRERQDLHWAWNGSTSNECDIGAAGANVHMDVDIARRLVHAVYRFPNERNELVFDGTAASPQRIGELAHAVRTVSVSGSLGR
jgi:hypothetical protein